MKRKSNKLFLIVITFIVSFIIINFLNEALAVNTILTNTINNMISDQLTSVSDKTDNQNLSKENKNNINRFAFILFYLHSCPHCQRFDPILRDFSENNKIPVLAYTLDGQSLPSFPNSVNPTKTEVMKFFPTKSPVVPTLFLMDQKTHRIYPVLQGEATEAQLSQRYSHVTEKISEMRNSNDGAKNVIKPSTPQNQDFSYE